MKKTNTPTISSRSTDNSLVGRILAAYGLDYTDILPPQQGYRNQSFAVRLKSGEMVNLILYKSEPGMLDRIMRTNDVADFAASSGLPVRQTHSTRIIQLKSDSGEKFGCLYNYLPGHTIPWEGYTRRHIKLLGKTMSNLHAVLAHFDAAAIPSVIAEYQAIVSRMQKYFASPDVQKAVREKLQLSLHVDFTRLQQILLLCQPLPAQVLHMDFVRGNILFDGTGDNLTITGILDFEKTAHGSRLFDIARTLAFLLVDCKYIEERKVRKYFLHSGYEKRGASSLDLRAELPGSHLLRDRHRFPMQRSEHFVSGEWSRKDVSQGAQHKHLLEELVTIFLIYDFYKFLRHNPYESLAENEHFIRTRDQLQKRQRLTHYQA